MMQDTQHLKAEIVSTLDLLSPDSLNALAKIATFLRSNTLPPEKEATTLKQVTALLDVNSLIDRPKQAVQIRSPRLVHRHQMADFQKEIVAIDEHDSIQHS